MENTVVFEAAENFEVPVGIVDKYLDAPELELRLILFLLRNANRSFLTDELAARPVSYTHLIIRLRLLEKATLLSTTLRTPIEEIIPYRINDIPPMIAAGIELIKAETIGKNETMTAKTAAMRITRGSYTLETVSYTHLSQLIKPHIFHV